jgi:hypothetical protein
MLHSSISTYPIDIYVIYMAESTLGSISPKPWGKWNLELTECALCSWVAAINCILIFVPQSDTEFAVDHTKFQQNWT